MPRHDSPLLVTKPILRTLMIRYLHRDHRARPLGLFKVPGKERQVIPLRDGNVGRVGTAKSQVSGESRYRPAEMDVDVDKMEHCQRKQVIRRSSASARLSGPA